MFYTQYDCVLLCPSENGLIRYPSMAERRKKKKKKKNEFHIL